MLAEPSRVQPRARHPPAHEIRHHHLGPPLRQPQVVVLWAGGVSVALQRHLLGDQLRVVERRRHPVKVAHRLARQLRRVEPELDPQQ